MHFFLIPQTSLNTQQTTFSAGVGNPMEGTHPESSGCAHRVSFQAVHDGKVSIQSDPIGGG
jgi:hypothetical protein